MNSISKEKVLFVNHKAKVRCGVYQFGNRIGSALQNSRKYAIEYLECGSTTDLKNSIKDCSPTVIIYNYHEQTMPWLTPQITSSISIPQVGIYHEITQEKTQNLNNNHFDGYIAADPTLILTNPLIHKTGRLVKRYMPSDDLVDSEIPVFGSFGFGLDGKGFDKVIDKVQAEFDEAIIKLHIPVSDFADPDGIKASQTESFCKSKITKPNISLEISHNFLDEDQLLGFLASNTLNIFCYEKYRGRGISSVIDYALAVDRPIALTKSLMFRHLGKARPSIFIEDMTLKDIIMNGTEPLKRFKLDFSENNLIWDYERIIEKYIGQSSKITVKIQQSYSLKKRLKLKIARLLKLYAEPNKIDGHIWSQGIELDIDYFDKDNSAYVPNQILSTTHEYNTILDNSKRVKFKPYLDLLSTCCPKTIQRKIPEANIQQAFIVDCVLSLLEISQYKNVLCIGSFEDSACETLRSIGVSVDGIDPMINYDLHTFLSKPCKLTSGYDVIFSTSVIEHVEDDEIFMADAASLLRPNGFLALTCDFEKNYKHGDRIPDCDYRFYTKHDLSSRLLSKAPCLEVYGKINWDYLTPDFHYHEYLYTFASAVYRKTR